jgi:inner membrane protein
MNGPSHMRIGAAGCVAVGWSMGAPAHMAAAVHPAHLPPAAEGALAAIGAALVCGAIGAVAGLLPDLDSESTLGAGLPAWWHRLTPGHRGLSHSLLAVALWWGGVWLACAGLGITGSASLLLRILIVAGVVSHLAADALTDHGIRPLYPFSSWHLRSPRPFKTGGRVEPIAVAVVVVFAVVWCVEPAHVLSLLRSVLR